VKVRSHRMRCVAVPQRNAPGVNEPLLITGTLYQNLNPFDKQRLSHNLQTSAC